MSDNNPEITKALKGLEQAEQIESLTYLIDKLPDLVNTIKIVEDKTDFLINILNDHQSLSIIANDTEEKIKNLQIDSTHFDALLKMTHMLPRIMPIMEQVENITDFLEDVFNDEQTVSTLIEGVNDIIPIKESTKIFEETNKHYQANQNQSDISIFGLMKMLKDPVVQDGLKFTKSMLHVINERK